MVKLVMLGSNVALEAGVVQLMEEGRCKLSISWLGMEQGGHSMRLLVIV